MAEPTDDVKAKLGATATFTWLAGGALLFLVDRGLGGLLSLRALLFLGVGMFVAAIVVGIAAYKFFLHRADKAAMAAGAAGARDAVVKTITHSQILSGVLSAALVVLAYAGLFK
jgi:hypothetical protein